MRLSTIPGMRSEVFAPSSPPPVWAPVSKPLDESRIAFVTGGGIHLKADVAFNSAGDITIRTIPITAQTSEMMVTHGGYDNGEVNKDINAMLPIDRLRELAAEGFIGGITNHLISFMGAGGIIDNFRNNTGPAILDILKKEGADLCVFTAG